MDNLQATDATLVHAYLQGDEKALSILINRHQHRIYSFIFSKVFDKDVAEDVFQDTFIKVINTLKRGKYNEEGKFLPWVMRIAHNLVIVIKFDCLEHLLVEVCAIATETLSRYVIEIEF